MTNRHLQSYSRRGGRVWQLILATLVLAMLVLSACTSSGSLNPWKRNNAVDTIVVIALPDANRRYSVSVDVVFVFDRSLAVPLGELTARGWFAGKAVYLNSYPQALKVLHLEPMPGRSTSIKDLPLHHARAERVLVFANYLSQDQPHRADISPLENVRILLQENHFTVETIQP